MCALGQNPTGRHVSATTHKADTYQSEVNTAIGIYHTQVCRRGAIAAAISLLALLRTRTAKETEEVPSLGPWLPSCAGVVSRVFVFPDRICVHLCKVAW